MNTLIVHCQWEDGESEVFRLLNRTCINKGKKCVGLIMLLDVIDLRIAGEFVSRLYCQACIQ